MKYVATRLERQQYIDEVEQVYQTSVGKWKPDIAASQGAIIINAQVRGEGANLHYAHEGKARYNGKSTNPSQEFRKKHGAMEYDSVTLNWQAREGVT